MAALLTRLAVALAAALIALCCGGAAAGFLIAALYECLRSLTLDPPVAAAIVAGVLLVIALVAILIARRSMAPRARLTARTASPATVLGAQAMQKAVEAADAHPYRATGLAFLAGLGVGVSRDLRGILRAALRAR